MFDRVFHLLLRLYPAAFRERYREEALQLYRDRLQDETGFPLCLRLWFDLFADAFAGLPQAWRNSYAAPAAIAAQGALLFRSIDPEPLRPFSLLAGNTLAIAFLCLFAWVVSVPHIASFSSTQANSPVETVMQRLNAPAPPPAPDADSAADQDSALGPALALPLDQAARHHIIQTVSDLLIAHYIDPSKARAATDSLLTQERYGVYNSLSDRAAFAAQLTQDLQASTQDRFLTLQFRRNAVSDAPPVRTAAELAEYRATMLQENCTFQKARTLPGNVGYLKFDFFPDASVCAGIARAALTDLAHSRAIILDLRDNLGGFPDMVADVAAPFFSHPVVWYNPRETPSTTTLAPADAGALAGKPLFILTSSDTFSGAEHFTWNLQMLHRATVVGETTHGGHPSTIRRVDAHFVLYMHEAKPPTPYGQPDWQGPGVTPNINVAASDALATAEKLATEKPHK